MKTKRFSVEQIFAVLKEAEAGMPLAELILFRIGHHRGKCARRSVEDHQVQSSDRQPDDFPQLPYDDAGVQGTGS